MKTTSFLLILFFMATINISKSQSVYYDATYLAKLIKGNKWPSDKQTISSVDSILSHYCKRDDINQTFCQDNPFIRDFTINWTDKSGSDFVGGMSISSISTSLGGLDVTNLADGMAKFLVKRTKQELAIMFFDRFKEAIADTACRDLRTLFPATYAVLYAISDQIYYYDAYIQTLRESFEKDLRDISSQLPSLIENHLDYFAHHPEIEAILLSGCYIADALKSEESFGVILRDYSVTYLDKVNPNIKASVKTLRLISESLRDTAIVTRPNAYWVSPQQIQMLVNDSIAFRIYLGLLYQQTKNDPILFGNSVTMTAVLDSIEKKYSTYSYRYRTYLTNLGARTNTLTDLKSKYKTLSNDTMKLEQYYQYISAGIDLLESASDVGRLGLNDSSISKAHFFFKHARNSLSAYITTIRSAANLVWDVKRRSYASAVVNAANIYSIVFPDTLKQIGANLLKYGTFMATIAQAKTSDDVESAIEATALPAGSARIKRESCFDVALNAYVGGFYGTETDQIEKISSSNTIYGINAPIGIALSTSLNIPYKWFDNVWYCYPQYIVSLPLYIIKSVTVFGSAVDIGAITAYRAKNDTVNNLPEFKLANIVAPGVHIVLGIRDVPLSIGFGWQIGPQLRNVTSTAAAINNAQGSRSAIFIAVDIPLMELYNKPKN